MIFHRVDIPHSGYPFLADEYLNCSHFLVNLLNAAINIHVHVFAWKYVSFLLTIYIEVELLSHVETLSIRF